MLLVPSGVVQVGERAQSCQDRSARVQHLDLQGVKRGGRGGLSSINMQPEGQVRRSGGRRDCDRLCGSISMGGSITILPCVPRSAVWRFGGGVVDDSGSQSPWSGIGAVLEPWIADELLRRSRADGQRDGGGVCQTARDPGHCNTARSGSRSASGSEREHTG